MSYLALAALAGWKHKKVKPPFDHINPTHYFCHAQTGRVVSFDGAYSVERAAYQLIRDVVNADL